MEIKEKMAFKRYGMGLIYLSAFILFSDFALINGAKPQINSGLGTITVNYCSAKEHVIPPNSYSDAEDGNLADGKLKLQLLDARAQLLIPNENNPVQLIGSTLYIVSIYGNGGDKTISLIIRIADTEQLRADDNFVVKFTGSYPNLNSAFVFKFNIKKKRDTSELAIKDYYNFYSTLSSKEFWDNKELSVMSVKKQLNNVASSELSVVDCKLSTLKCDVSQLLTMINKVKDQNQWVNITNKFTTSIQSMDLEITSFAWDSSQMCQLSDYPKRDLEQDFWKLQAIKTLYTTNVLEIRIPEGAFLYEGITMAQQTIKVYFLNNDKKRVDGIGSWIGQELENGVWVLYAVTSDQLFSYISTVSQSTFEYDKKTYAMAYIQSSILLEQPEILSEYYVLLESTVKPATNYIVEFHMKIIGIARQVYPKQIKLFLSKLTSILGNEYKDIIYIKNYVINSNQGSDGEGVLQWSILMSECDLQKIKYIRSIMFRDGDRTSISDQMKTKMKKEFELTNIMEKLEGSCNSSPPKQVKALKTIELSYCGIEMYQIPDDAFNDKEDGNTAKLTFDLYTQDGKTVDSSNFIQFDKSTRTIYGLLPDDYSGPSGELSYKLRVRDSSDQYLETNIKVKLLVDKQKKIYDVKLSSKFTANVNGFQNPGLVLGLKIGKYFGDEGKGFRLVSTETSTNGEKVITFGNCTWSTTVCDVLKLENYEQKLFVNAESLNPTLRSVLQPEFQDVKITTIKNSPCNNDEKPKIDNPVKDIVVSTCSTKQVLVPENTFSDKEQGNTRSLQLSIKSIAFSDTKMLEFNSKTQTITIVASETDDASYNYQLTATDINNNQAATIFTVAVNKQQKQPAFKVSVEFRILRSNLNNYVALYSFIRQKFKTYLGDGDMENTFQILKTNSVSNNFGMDSVHSIEWTNCTMSRDLCPTEEIGILQRKILAGEEIKEELKSFFSDDIFFLGVSVKNSGICEEQNKPPKLLNPIPNQNLGYCGPLIYRIPENTFSDSIDGNTDTLDLQLAFGNGSLLPADFYIWLDKDTKTLHGLLADKKNTFSKASFNLILGITATNKRGLSISSQFTLLVNTNIKQLSSVFSVSFFMNRNFMKLNKIMLFSTLSSKLSNFFGWNIADVYIHSYVKAGIFGRLSFTSCKVSQDPCDHDFIRNVENKALSNGQTSEAIRKELESSDVPDVTYFSVELLGDKCQGNKIPVYTTALKPFTVTGCQSFAQKFNEFSFLDEEDTKLTYTIVKIDAQFVDLESSWIGVNSTSHEFIGVVPYESLHSLRSIIHNVTVRAIDKEGKFAEGNVLVTIEPKQINKFYAYEMKFTTSKDMDESLGIKLKFTKGVNSFYGSQPSTSISFFEKTGNMYTIRWRSCLLPNSCLTSQTINSESSKLFNSGNTPTSNLANSLQGFLISSLSLISDPLCDGPLNPPLASLNPLSAILSICGGFTFKIPEYQFLDDEDGKTKDLTVTLTTKSMEEISKSFPWMNYDIQTYTLIGYPSLYDAEDFNNRKPVFLLTAIDKTGLSVTINFKITFNSQATPKFFYTIGYTTVGSTTTLVKSEKFLVKISTYLGDPSEKDIGIATITQGEFRYFNCSVSYDPCDWSRLMQIRDKLATVNGIPLEKFKNAMSPEYIPNYVTIQYQPPCKIDGSNTPEVVTKLQTQYIMMCSFKEIRIPHDVFYDLEDGDTRNLDLNLVNVGTFSYNEWLHFSKLERKISLIGSAKAARLQPTNGYLFSLIATDKSSKSTATNLLIKIQGPYKILEECKLEMQLTFDRKITDHLVEIAKIVATKMAIYFDVSIEEIGIVEVQKTTDFKILVFWSYCSPQYRSAEYSSNSDDLKIDYYYFIVKILLQLYQNDRKTVRNEFIVSFGNNIVVDYVQPVFSGRCSNLPPIVYPGSKNIQMILYYTGYTKHFYENTIFYDFEDGWAYDLYLTLRKENNASTAIDHWINVDTISHHIYAVSDNTVRMFTSSSFIYYLHAHDTGGKSTAIKTMVTIQRKNIQLTPFNFTFIFKHEGRQSQVFVNQSVYMINKITTYYSLPSISRVILLYFTSATGDLNLRSMIWTVVDHTCNSELLKKALQMQNENAIKLNSNFVSAFRNLVEMKRFLISSSCVDKTKIVVQYNISIQEITFCTIYSYQLPENLFYDPNDGRLINLQTNLLNGNGQEVGKSSWLQINSANLMLYGVAIRSIGRSQSKSKFQIQTRNNAGNTKALTFDTEIKDQPFTTDCPITMKFAYKYISTETRDIDVLREFINMIKQFYKDKTVLIKILNFARQENAFIVSWSNCSTVFQSTITSQAKYGYEDTVEIRNKINAVFNVIYENKMVKSTFKKFMETMFTITSLTVSYCCIEKAPETNTQEIRKNAYFCTPFHEVIPEDLFIDECDGRTRNLKLSLLLSNGIEVGKNNWVQLDKEKQVIFGTVTEEVKRNAPITGFRYILKAEDYSGRSTEVIYIINIVGDVQIYDAYFVTGFTNGYDEIIPTATILNETRWKLSESVKSEVYVKEFKYPEVIIWTKCKLIKCSHVGIADTLQKLQIQTYIANPNVAFKNLFSALMKPFWIQSWIWNTACGSGIITIVINVNMPTNITEKTCGMFKYNIPDSLFSASVPMSSKNFVYALELSNNSPLSRSSMVQLNSARQFIYGYAVTMQMRQQYFEVKLNAFHPMSGAKSSAKLIFNFPNKKITQKLYNKSCRINTTVISNYRYAYNDVDILNFFSNTMSSYLKTDGIEILSYSRVDGIRSMWNIIWSDCSTLFTFYQDQNSLTYTRSMKSMISKLIRKENGMTYVKIEFSKWFLKKSKFDIQNITFNKNCEEPPTEPPIPNRPLNDIELPTCGYFEMQIPEDTFKDNLDGNTRNLLLQLYNSDGTTIPPNEWIFLNSTQFLVGYVNDIIRTNSPSNGYIFTLTAQNTAGLTASINFVLKTTSLPSIILPKFNAIVRSSTDLDEKNLMNWKLSVLKLMAQLYEDIKQNQVDVTFDKFMIKNDGTIDLTLTFCQCYTISYIKIVFLEATKLTTPFSVISSNDETPSTCGELKPVAVEASYTLEYCSFFSEKINILSVATSFSLRDSENKTLPKTSIAWLNNIILEVFPGNSIWNDNRQKELNYILNSKYFFSTELSVMNVKINIPVIANKPKTLDFSITLSTSKEDSSKMNAFFISLTLNNLRILFSENLQFSKFERLATDPFKFLVGWKMCINGTSCESDVVKNITKKLVSPNFAPSNLAVKTFSPYIIEKIETQCDNWPPTSVKSYNITLKECGKFKYKLPISIANDTEDGNFYSLSAEMKMQDQSPITRTSWIQFDDTSKTITAIPTETIYKQLEMQSKTFLLSIKDKGEKITTTSITIHAEKVEDHLHYYKVNLRFQSNLPSTTPYVDIQLKILEKLKMFTEGELLANVQVTAFDKVEIDAETYFMSIVSCSIKKEVCVEQNNKITTLENRIANNQGVPTDNVIKSMSPEITLTNAQFLKSYTIDQAPEYTNKFQTVEIDSCCQSQKYCFPNETFTDFEDGNVQNLEFTLTNADGSKIDRSSSFIELINKCLYVVPSSKTAPGLYEYSLSVLDKCKNKKTVTLRMKTNKCPESFAHKLSLRLKKEGLEEQLNYKDVDALRQKLTEVLHDEIQLTISEMNYQQPYTTITFGICSSKNLKCNFDLMKNISSLINKENIRSSLKGLNFDLDDITEVKHSECLVPPPKTHYLKLSYNFTFCERIEKMPPADLFYSEDGLKTRDFQITLLTNDGNDVEPESWIQFNQTSQTLYGYPRFTSSQQFNRQFDFKIQAKTNGTDKGTTIPLCIYLNGNQPVLDYQLELEARIFGTYTLPDVFYEMKIIEVIEKISNGGPLNSIRLVKNTRFPYIIDSFRWSFCSARMEPCDCKLINQTTKLFTSDDGLLNLQNDVFAITKMSKNIDGKCKNTRKPDLVKSVIDYLEIESGKPFKVSIPADSFTDYEDGGMDNLTLCIKNAESQQLKPYDWLKVYNNTICGIFTDYSSLGNTVDKTFKYSLVAKDNCGKDELDSFSVKVTESFKSNSTYCLIINQPFEKLNSNCSWLEQIIKVIAIIHNHPQSEVTVTKIAPKNDHQTTFEWKTVSDKDVTCLGNDTGTSDQFKENGVMNEKLISQMKSMNITIADFQIKCTVVISSTKSKTQIHVWLIILIIILLLLFLLFWCLWLLIPRFCPSCFCARVCPPCCSRTGTLSSVLAIDDSRKTDSAANLPQSPSTSSSSNESALPRDKTDSGLPMNLIQNKEIVPGPFADHDKDKISIDSGHFSDSLDLPPFYDGNVKMISDKRLIERSQQRITRDESQHYNKFSDLSSIKINFHEDTTEDKTGYKSTQNDFNTIKQVERTAITHQPSFESWRDPRQTSQSKYVTWDNEKRLHREESHEKSLNFVNSRDYAKIHRMKVRDHHIRNSTANSGGYRRSARTYYVVNDSNNNTEIYRNHKPITVMAASSNSNDTSSQNVERYVTDKRSRYVDALVDNRYLSSRRHVHLHRPQSTTKSSSNYLSTSDDYTSGYTSDTSLRDIVVLRRKNRSGKGEGNISNATQRLGRRVKISKYAERMNLSKDYDNKKSYVYHYHETSDV